MPLVDADRDSAAALGVGAALLLAAGVAAGVTVAAAAVVVVVVVVAASLAPVAAALPEVVGANDAAAATGAVVVVVVVAVVEALGAAAAFLTIGDKRGMAGIGEPPASLAFTIPLPCFFVRSITQSSQHTLTNMHERTNERTNMRAQTYKKLTGTNTSASGFRDMLSRSKVYRNNRNTHGTMCEVTSITRGIYS